LKLRYKIKERRDEIYIVASELPEKPGTDPVPKEQSDRLPGSAGRSNANENNQEPLRDRDDQSSESRSLGDPPGTNRSIKDGGMTLKFRAIKGEVALESLLAPVVIKRHRGGDHVPLFQL
jgi:hypothetical protein